MEVKRGMVAVGAGEAVRPSTYVNFEEGGAISSTE